MIFAIGQKYIDSVASQSRAHVNARHAGRTSPATHRLDNTYNAPAGYVLYLLQAATRELTEGEEPWEHDTERDDWDSTLPDEVLWQRIVAHNVAIINGARANDREQVEDLEARLLRVPLENAGPAYHEYLSHTLARVLTQGEAADDDPYAEYDAPAEDDDALDALLEQGYRDEDMDGPRAHLDR